MTGTPSYLLAIVLATLAGATIPLGAWLARFESLIPSWIEDEFRHTVMAFGGGALLAAVGLVLVPEGVERLHNAWAIIWFCAGGAAFCVADYVLAKNGSHVAQFMAMMLDYVPEAMALGAMLVGETEVALLIAGLIALQNLPEGFNAWREMAGNAPAGSRRLFVTYLAMVPLGPAAALVGLGVLSNLPGVLGAIMLFSAGGILYLVFEDIAPNVRLENRWRPPLGAVAGFALGLAGYLATGG